jgi:3-isopropylmalate/(R)-2-methylmalate dehydratase small subunit
MQPFTRFTAIAAPIDRPNVDTDQIIPARFLRKPRETPAYATFLFHDVRFHADGTENPEFVLNRPAFRSAAILVVADNFGCGSSREMAVWALDAHGLRVVIASSLGDIFLENCVKNGLLPVSLPDGAVTALRRRLHERPGTTLSVDLDDQTVLEPDGTLHRFEIDAFRKEMLQSGRDEIALTLGHEAALAAFEARRRQEAPWLTG